MAPTLEPGDRLEVDESRRCCKRGDIVVVRTRPNAEWRHLGISAVVHRVVGLPGETISQCEEVRVCINGKRIRERYLPKGTLTSLTTSFPYVTGVDGEPSLVCEASSGDSECVVPPGEYFVMGDNRMNSQDSRANGPVRAPSIVGIVTGTN